MKPFKSAFAKPFDDFVDWKRAQGFKYEEGKRNLGYFDNFLANQEIELLVFTKQHLQDYKAAVTPLGKTARHTRFGVVMDFARYYHQIEPKSALMEIMPFKKAEDPRPFAFTLDHIKALVQEARQLKPAGTIRPHSMAMLIALVYLTGLRIGEALRLTIEDFRSDPYRLFIANSKFGKDRWVLLKDSMALKLRPPDLRPAQEAHNYHDFSYVYKTLNLTSH